MRVCDNCGHIDPQYWRQNRWVSNVDYSRYEDVLKDYPFLVDMRPGETRSDKYNYYYRSKKQRAFIYRWPKFLGPQYYPKTRHLFERHVPRAPPSKEQKFLVAAPSQEASL